MQQLDIQSYCDIQYLSICDTAVTLKVYLIYCLSNCFKHSKIPTKISKRNEYLCKTKWDMKLPSDSIGKTKWDMKLPSDSTGKPKWDMKLPSGSTGKTKWDMKLPSDSIDKTKWDMKLPKWFYR